MVKPKVLPPFIQAAIDKKAAKGGVKKPAIKITSKVAIKAKPMAKAKKAC